jgi:hypothetical protein
MQEKNKYRIKKLNNSFSNIFKSIRGSYNLLDFAQKSKGKPLPRSRKSIKKEYEILNAYKDGLLLKNEAINNLTNLKDIDQIQAEKKLENIRNNQVIPMKIK